jgi:hypothetical protein
VIALLLALVVGTAHAADVAVLGDVDEASLGKAVQAAGLDGEAVVGALPPYERVFFFTGGYWVDAQSAGQLLPDAMAEARAQIDDFEPAAAVAILAAALNGVPRTGPLDRAAYLQALELYGEAAQEAGDPASARTAYRLLLAADPAHEIQVAPGTGYDELYNEVRREMNQRPLVTASIQFERATVWWDGQRIEPKAAPLSVQPGRHLLQWNAGNATAGAWIDVEEDTALIWAADAQALLERGPADAGAQAALGPWLRSLREPLGASAVAVVQSRKPLRGYTVTDDGITAWAGGLEAIARGMSPDRVRIALGGGYAATIESFQDEAGEGQTLASNFGGASLALDVKVISFLHARVRGDLLVSEPARLGGGDEEVVALLPGVTAGVVVHPEKGVIQPWGGVSGGVWIAPPGSSAAQRQAAADKGVDAGATALVEGRGAVTPRVVVEGGIDLVPGGGPLVIRVQAGAGAGFGFEARAGAAVGVRFGR